MRADGPGGLLARFSRPRRPTSVQASLASIVLGFELFIVFLAALVTFGLRATDPVVALVGGGVLCILLVVAMGLLRVRVGFVLGWILQFVMVATGILVPIMFLIGGFFAAIWIYCMVVGSRIDAQKRAYAAAQEEPASPTDDPSAPADPRSQGDH